MMVATFADHMAWVASWGSRVPLTILRIAQESRTLICAHHESRLNSLAADDRKILESLEALIAGEEARLEKAAILREADRAAQQVATDKVLAAIAAKHPEGAW